MKISPKCQTWDKYYPHNVEKKVEKYEENMWTVSGE